MGLFNYSDKTYTISDLCTLSSNIGALLSAEADSHIKEYESNVSTEFLDYKTPDLCLRYIQAINELDLDGESLINELDRVFDCLIVLKEMIDSYTNHVLNRNLNAKIKEIKDNFDHIEKISKDAYDNLNKKEHQTICEREETCRKIKLAELDCDRTNHIVDFTQRKTQDNYDISISYIKRRQFLRRKIYENLMMNPNMTWHEICGNINEMMASVDADVLNVILPEKYFKSKRNREFTVYGIYVEWTSVKAEIVNGTFGFNYPDDVPDDYDEAVEYLKAHLVNVFDDNVLESKSKDDNNDTKSNCESSDDGFDDKDLLSEGDFE